MINIITKLHDFSFSQSKVKVEDLKTRPKKPTQNRVRKYNLFNVFPSRTAYFKNSFFIFLIHEWNKLNLNICNFSFYLRFPNASLEKFTRPWLIITVNSNISMAKDLSEGAYRVHVHNFMLSPNKISQNNFTVDHAIDKTDSDDTKIMLQNNSGLQNLCTLRTYQRRSALSVSF